MEATALAESQPLLRSAAIPDRSRDDEEASVINDANSADHPDDPDDPDE